MMPAVEDTLELDTSDVPAGRPRSALISALKTRDFALLFGGQLASEIGNGLVQLALPFLVLQLTGSAFQLGLAYFIQFLPILLFGLIGGVFVDRWDRRATIIIVDSIRTMGFLSVGVIYYLGGLTAAHLYLVIFLESALANFFNPARAALMPNLLHHEDLRAGNSLMEVSRYLGAFIAPPVGAVLTAQLGGAALMLIDGVSFAISVVTVVGIAYRQPPVGPTSAVGLLQSIEGVISETRAGLKRILESYLLKVAIILGFSLNAVVAPIQLLLPLFVRNVKHTDASYFGVLVAGLLAGSITGALSAPSNARRFGLGHVTIASVLILGVVITMAAWPPFQWPAVLAMAVAGCCLGTLTVAQTTLIQGSTSDDERGRVSATYYTATNGVRPIAFLVMGALASAVDIRYLFSVLGVLVLFLGAWLSRSHQVRAAH
jgi:MFS family permease